MSKELQVVAFNVPFPADYGGVIDVYYKIKTLHRQGVKIYLHCFQYGREEAKELEEICEAVYYYPRKHLMGSALAGKPFIVHSRRSPMLLQRLANAPYPILFEGLHTCLYLDHPQLKSQVKMVRMHNIEWQYYEELSKKERGLWEKLYLHQESIRLRKYEHILSSAGHIFAISLSEKEYLEKHYSDVTYLPAFHPNEEVDIKSGFGKYCLYQGNLSVPENIEAVLYLVENIFNEINIPLVIAGKNPSPELQKKIDKCQHIQLIANPSKEILKQLMEDAHIHILPTFQETGIKLKLLNALFTGRFCLVNSAMVKNTGLGSLCVIADSAEDMRQQAIKLMEQEFKSAEIAARKNILSKSFNNGENAKIITAFLSEGH